MMKILDATGTRGLGTLHCLRRLLVHLTLIFAALPVNSAFAPAQQAYVKASNAEEGDQFGWSVAISGDTMVVGAPFESSGGGINGNEQDNNVWDSGAAYVYVRNGTNWTKQAYLKASNPDRYDNFGGAVAVSGDTIVIGAIGEASNATGVNGNQADNSVFGRGAVYVFVRNGTNWTQQAYLKPSNHPAEFGFSVAVSGDTIIVGAPIEASRATGVNGDQNDMSAGASGAAYVFVRNGTNWMQQAYLKASNTGDSDEFGRSVAMSGDIAVVGAWLQRAMSDGAGAAYVFARTGTNWTQQAFLKPPRPDTGDMFGVSVAVSGQTVVVGAPGEDSNATGVNGTGVDVSPYYDSGAAFVYMRDGTNWIQAAYLKASNGDIGDEFGKSVGISGDAIVVGAWSEDSNSTGINGAQDNNTIPYSGAAYVFVRQGTNWTQQAYLKASNTGTNDLFGTSVGISGHTVAVAALWEDSSAVGVNGEANDDSAPDSGAAYIFGGLAYGPGIGCHVTPEESVGITGAVHRVMAHVTSNSFSVAGIPVSFTIISGPNAAGAATVFTDLNGDAVFAYSGSVTVGTDVIEANGSISGIPFSCIATHVWGTVPTIQCPADFVTNSFAGSRAQSVTFNAAAFGSPPPQIEFRAGGTLVVSPYSFPVGITTVQVAASNALGTASCSFNVTVDEPHDLAVVKIIAPKSMALTAARPVITKRVAVTIQNRSAHNETIASRSQLEGLVSLAVHSLDTNLCGDITPVLLDGRPQRTLPLTLRPKQKFNVYFVVSFGCAVNPNKGGGFEDFSYVARVDHRALGVPDSHPECDVCPRLPLDGGRDPNPDGRTMDKGCGTARGDGTFGSPVFTDVFVK